MPELTRTTSPANQPVPPAELPAVQSGEQIEHSANTQTNPSLADYRELLEFQGRQTEQMLAVQGRAFEAAVDASTQSLQSIELVLLVAAFLISTSSLAAGWFFKRIIDRIQSTADRSERIIQKQTKEIADLSSELTNFRGKVTLIKSEISEIQNIKSGFENLTDTFRSQEEHIEALAAKTRIALLGLDLHSESREERLRAAEAISEIIRSRLSHPDYVSFGVALKLFLDCLRRKGQYSDITREVLYGLQHCAEIIAKNKDAEAVALILSSSRSPHSLVRMQALETLGRIGFWHQEVEERFWECMEGDDDLEVKAIAVKTLREAGKLGG